MISDDKEYLEVCAQIKIVGEQIEDAKYLLSAGKIREAKMILVSLETYLSGNNNKVG